MPLGWVRREHLDRAKVDAYSAHDRLDAVLSENERLLKLLSDERERNEMMAVCVIDTLREALGMEQPVTAPTVASDWKGVASVPDMPKEIEAAIATTFPGDKTIYDANVAYAWSQEHRWENYAKEVAEEIRQGERV